MPTASANSSMTRLGGIDRIGGAGAAIGGRLGLVDDHVIAVDLHVLQPIGRQDHAAAAADPAAGKAAGVVGQVGLGRRDDDLGDPRPS